ncbi:SRPBCC domain-containing protein [Planotetraspora sp. A-T 1434]|uniref:SRPBCC family protein n=1 Tax=Planotetraspora sp. A-T 1434 TaxID=2979219 RepID=UPI0021BFBFFD|nr:SRPBCC domain-containing protein [Planotetraspora sp. A-T 1434]MCT9933045.1 SRPBCC domain-containing protein [Planotetraspora sp. A-T 1434]
MGRAFELRKEVELEASPEQVWEAIATGPGVDSWFMGRNVVEPGEGGIVRLTLGGQSQENTVTAWEPGKRLAHRGAEPDDGSFMAIEYLLEGRDGGGTVLRMVQSGVLGDDWETEYEAMKTGWDMYLHKLVQYLTYFPGRSATPVFAIRQQGTDPERAWEAFTRELGLSGTVAEGDKARITLDGSDPVGGEVEGVVDYVDHPIFLGVRTPDALYRFIHSGPARGNVVVLGHHLFFDADQHKAEASWQSWLDAVLT